MNWSLSEQIAYIEAAQLGQELREALLGSLRDAERYQYFRTRWEAPISWQHQSIEDYDVVNDDGTCPQDATWGDERIGLALDRAIDSAIHTRER